MTDIDSKPEFPVDSIPSDELAEEAREHGVEGDEAVLDDGDGTHLPASEAPFLKEEGHGARPAGLTQLPPD